jgi:hypothetical protein
MQDQHNPPDLKCEPNYTSSKSSVVGVSADPGINIHRLAWATAILATIGQLARLRLQMHDEGVHAIACALRNGNPWAKSGNGNLITWSGWWDWGSAAVETDSQEARYCK